VITEEWTFEHIFCPVCGQTLSKYPNNTPVGDFFCKNCQEDFELKSKQ
jgi:type II restriction enzyme